MTMDHPSILYLIAHAGRRHYYVDSGGRWFVVHCLTKRMARSIGVAEFGRGQVDTVRAATPDEIMEYAREKNDGKPLELQEWVS